MSCIVRVAELGSFYAPTDKADVNCMAKAQTLPAQGHPRDPVWQHEELLELPGGEVDSVVAVRPNWYMLFEVIDSDPRAVDAPPLAVAAAPLSDVLTQSYEVQAPEKTSSVLQKRIEQARSPIMPAKSKIAALPGAETNATVPIVRELPLVVRRGTLEAQDQSAEPSKSRLDRLKKGTKSLTKMVTKSVTKSLTKKLDIENLPEGPSLTLSLEDGIHEDDRVLVVRFEVLSRWKGTGGGAKCPPTRPMLGPSPVLSLVSLISSVVAGHQNGNIFVWDVTGSSSVPLHQFEAHKAPISCMVYMPTLDSIISTAMPMNRKEAVSESLLRVWSCSAFELRQTLPLHGSGSRCLIPLDTEGKEGSFVLALGKDSRQSSLLQFFKLEPA
uniref:Uncharacterized protein n=1 Tax=Alexandrium andersonii TaxID=327968 RepID=A0A7S2C8Q6_9DINO